MSEPITFVVERRNGGGESPSIIHGKLPTRLTHKGSQLLVYALRLDKLPNGAELASMPIGELYALFGRLRKAGKLPPPNLADPPRKETGERGMLRGEASWWRPTPLPRGQDWRPA